MRIAIGCDHGGFEHKETLKKYLMEQGYEVTDFGIATNDAVDYPDIAYPCSKAVANHEVDRGILICGTGIGVSMVANKTHGVRCALCSDLFSAKATREHNDSNMLAMGGRVISQEMMLDIVKVWLETEFSHDERHQRRIDKLMNIEQTECEG